MTSVQQFKISAIIVNKDLEKMIIKWNKKYLFKTWMFDVIRDQR